MNEIMRKIFLAFIFSLSASSLFAQVQNPSLGQLEDSNPIITAVPFLMIAPDARSGGMGDVGGAISPDANSMHWNIGKMAFIENNFGASLSYTPWLGKIVDDMNIAYLALYYKLDDLQAISGSLRYFDLGDITFTDENNQIIRPYNPQEYAFDLSYSRKLSDKLGIGVTGRFIHSNLTGDGVNGLDTKPGNSLAADIGLYYTSDLAVGARQGSLAFAAVVSNIGNKISYLDESTENFIPTNLRLGTAYTASLDPYNKITLAVDLNKLLVPTPPTDPNRSLVSGIFTSFSDAPGGFSEEAKEVNIASGLEYWYNDLFAARTGYFWEHGEKGGRQFFTLGVGLRYQVFSMDFAYLIPQQQQHPLAETLRFTLGVNFGGDN
ncbi:type IX secretion system outer membrane channel protein PorV [Cesiribacter andamanensis]|uniref:Type IX secretion system protein PorV domain-containing protein n=1 Tax=Cesiribacter andamanensis AMV16 TaxID=1279009 RepID=M7NBA4_9BACT|nr:type IX secretion system outer membrane channel protein PorV [Cesiribacter andamanensis]EMR04557.1 hypothetical protein ADICEAN_00315 [Cesiribacter andamanensis AMV16]